MATLASYLQFSFIGQPYKSETIAADSTTYDELDKSCS